MVMQVCHNVICTLPDLLYFIHIFKAQYHVEWVSLASDQVLIYKRIPPHKYKMWGLCGSEGTYYILLAHDILLSGRTNISEEQCLHILGVRRKWQVIQTWDKRELVTEDRMANQGQESDIHIGHNSMSCHNPENHSIWLNKSLITFICNDRIIEWWLKGRIPWSWCGLL